MIIGFIYTRLNNVKMKIKSITSKKINNFYSRNTYVSKNPSMHEEDSTWKIYKIIPFIDECMKKLKKKRITILDVGGGSGLILREISK